MTFSESAQCTEFLWKDMCNEKCDSSAQKTVTKFIGNRDILKVPSKAVSNVAKRIHLEMIID